VKQNVRQDVIPGLVVNVPMNWADNDLPVVYAVSIMYVGIYGALNSAVFVKGMPGQAKHIAECMRSTIMPPFNDAHTGNVFINVWSLRSDRYHEMVNNYDRDVDYRTLFTKDGGFIGNDNNAVHSDDTEI
jgi:hypothetical protein